MKTRSLALLMATSAVAMGMPKTFADESGKSQTTDKGEAARNNITSTETRDDPTGKQVDNHAADEGADLNADAVATPAEGVKGATKQPKTEASEAGVSEAAVAEGEAATAEGQKTGDPNLTDEQFSDPSATRKVETDEEKAAREKAEADAAASKVTKDVVPPEYREKYASGNGTCGDFIATEISAMTKEGGVAALNGIKKENGIGEGRWAELNNGMQRMNLANTLRAGYMRGETIKIGGKEHSLASALVEFEGEGEDRSPIALDDAKELGQFIRMIDLQDNDRTRAALKKALGPKPEPKAKISAEDREKAKADKAAAREAEKADKLAKREAEKKAKDEAKTKAATEREAAKKKAADERAEAKRVKDEAKANTEAAKKAAAEAGEKSKAEAEARKAGDQAKAETATKNVEDGKVKESIAKDDPKKADAAVANAAKGKSANQKAGATK